MKNPLVVLPHSRIKSNTEKFQAVPGLDALKANHKTDAHAITYYFPDGRPCPRLRLGSLPDLIEAGAEPVVGWIFLDVDNQDHRRWSSDEAEAHWATLKHNPVLERAGFYSTRGGYRLVFRLGEPIKASVASSYIQQFSAYIREAGIPIDPHCVERWNTLFRLPNVNRDGEKLRAFVDISRLKKAIYWVPPLPLQTHIVPKSTMEHAGQRPELQALGPLAWNMLETCKDLLGGKWEALRQGKPIAEKGARQSTMFKIAASIIGRLELETPHLVYQALAPSVVSGMREGSTVTLDELWDRCSYLVQLDKDKRKAREEVKQRVEGNQPPIVYHGSAYYIHDTAGKTYRPPVPGPAICQALEQWTKIPGMETRTKHNKPRAVSEYLADFGRQAVEVIVEMGRNRGVYLADVNGGTLIDGCCLPAEIQPEENQDVAEWLKYLAGDHHEKLLDWVATAARLDRPTCALYIQGPPGTGKGMFAAGIASIWGTGATSYADATGKFNAALTRNPIVLVDEMFQSFDTNDGFSGGFRTLIGESSRQLRRKNLPSATLRGCPRLIIAANNADALKLNENLGKDDLYAIAERILHIKHGSNPRDFLTFQGGREFSAGWVLDDHGRPGAIAKHALWLAKTRTVKTGTRFLVQGEISDWHRDLMGNSGIQGATLAALAHFIDRKHPTKGIEVSGQYVYVNVPTLRGLWGLLMGDQPPREGVLANALKTLAGGRQTRRTFQGSRLRCYEIELSDVLRRAESLQIGDVEEFENLSNKGSVENDRRHPEA